MNSKIDIAALQAEARSPEFRKELVDLLMDLCRIDTTPQADVAAYGAAEGEALSVSEAYLQKLNWPKLEMERKPIDFGMAKHPFYSRPYYTRTEEGGKELSVEETYAGRANLVVTADGAGANPKEKGLALDVHVDVVRPYIPPRIEGDRVFGRGSCDDKGPLTCLLGAMKLVRHALDAKGQSLAKPLTAMIVIEEETGGNGSLSLALDRELKKRYDTMMVLECCSNQIHPGNRGAVWYKAEGKLPGVNLFEASAFIIEEMEREGMALRSESRHELFPHRPVQTCHGMMGTYGEHPSRICGRIDFEIRLAKGAKPAAGLEDLIRDVIEEGLRQYVGVYGDKTKVQDPATGKPKVEKHYDLVKIEGGFRVQVHGSTGHMGSILQNDGAITKMASFVRALVTSRPAIDRAAGAPVELRLSGWEDQSHLLMEGGQGFLPTHPMDEVQQRMRRAVWRGADRYLQLLGRAERAEKIFEVTYDKLHNAAFAGRADSEGMKDAIKAAKTAGMWDGSPVRGWDVSCDSRLFATEYPDATVLTSGPGHLVHAHGDLEQIEIADMVTFTEFLALFILEHAGTV